MQSQLEAALLGLGGSFYANLFEDRKRHMEEGDDDADAAEEEHHVQTPTKSAASVGRNITLQTLLDVGILEPGTGVMTIEYLGQKFVGDLLPDGKIHCQESGNKFVSPSAWTVSCKQVVNPDKKSGSGWTTVKYKGKKLDTYKNIWYQYRKEEEYQKTHKETNMANIPMQRIVVKHNTIANRTFTHDANTMVECVPFSNLGKIQPFLISLSTNAAFLMDFHCHLTKSEVSGYLAGHWDVNNHSLQITHAFPCKNTKAERELASQVEAEISRTIEREKLTLVGWYHSHPFTAAAPTLRDIDAQLDYQIRMKGFSDNSYTPCVGLILSPYNYENTSLESSIIAYWVIPPPEQKPNEYGRPMLMSYSVMHDASMPTLLKNEIKKCVDYYKKEVDFLNFSEKYFGSTTFADKLKSSLGSKFPSEQKDSLWNHIKEVLGITADDKDSLLSIPSVSKSSQLLMNLNPPTSLNSNLMLTSDIANVLFNSGKFPSATSLLGLPDPMAHSTLAANNMFLQSNLFKMQELLKPLSTSSPISKPSKSDLKMPSSHLKIPTDLKAPKLDFPTDLNILALKNKLEFATPDLQASKSKPDFSLAELSNLSNSLLSLTKDFSMGKDYSIPDLSASGSKSSKSDFTLNLSSKSALEHGERPSKLPKTDYSLDLSQKSYLPSYPTMPSDLSVQSNAADDLSRTSNNEQKADQPLDLHSEPKN